MIRIQFPAALLLGVFASLQAVHADPGQLFPKVKSETLAKQKLVLPDDFKAQRNVILISFGRDMQKAVDAWDAALAPVRDGTAVQVYNTPLIPNPGAIVRGFISGGMRSVYKDPAVRERVVVLYVDEDEYFPALGVGDKSAPLVVVTDRTGRELGRVQSEVTDDALGRVQALIAAPDGAPNP
ncbi:MAG: hypothetical protein KDE14_09680 [Rhodobacteraceae bacterium]|nr:hypothetical protein [Paracoccaceae bacterium]